MSIRDKLREVLGQWEDDCWRMTTDERNGVEHCIANLRTILDEPEAPSDAVESVEERVGGWVLVDANGHAREEETGEAIDADDIATAMLADLQQLPEGKWWVVFRSQRTPTPSKADQTPSDAVESVEGVPLPHDTYVRSVLDVPLGKEYTFYLVEPTPTPESVEGERTHVWDDTLERCEVCGDKDWLADPVCPGPSAKMEVFNEHRGSVVYGLPGLELMIDCAPGVQVIAQPNGRFLAERTPEPAPLPWVSVEERMPEVCERVVVATSRSTGRVACEAYWNDRAWISSVPIRNEVTHWCPLSALPLPDGESDGQ